MKKSKHTEEQIIGVLKQVLAGRTVKEVVRELGSARRPYPYVENHVSQAVCVWHNSTKPSQPY